MQYYFYFRIEFYEKYDTVPPVTAIVRLFASKNPDNDNSVNFTVKKY